MGVIWWWLGAVTLAVLGLVVVARLLWRPDRHKVTEHDLWVAGGDRLRALPRFRTLVLARLRRLRLALAGLAIAALGGALLVSRLVVVANDDELMRNRDVMLCLDVSASMEEVDTAVVEAFTQVSRQLASERIGLVAFDSGAVTLFPLTSDAAFIQQSLGQVDTMVRDLSSTAIPGTRIGNAGSSLIGDGLASCANRFDRLDEPRSRTIVLATDGLVSGAPIYGVDEAAELAAANDVMVFVIAPNHEDQDALAGLKAAARTTSGDLLTLTAGQPTNIDIIISAVEAQQKQAILASAQKRSFDQPLPAALLICLGLMIVVITDWRGRR